MTSISIEWGDVLRVVIPALTGAAGVLGGYLLAEKNGLRSVEAASFAAGTLRSVCANIIDEASDDQEAKAVADAYVASNSLEICRDVLVHVRATDLPEAIRIDTLAFIAANVRFSEAVIKQTAQTGNVAFLHERLQKTIDVLDPILKALDDEERQLKRPLALKWLDRLNPFRKS